MMHLLLLFLLISGCQLHDARTPHNGFTPIIGSEISMLETPPNSGSALNSSSVARLETEPDIAFDYGFYYYQNAEDEPKRNTDLLCPASCVAPSPEHAYGTPESCDTWVRSAVNIVH